MRATNFTVRNDEGFHWTCHGFKALLVTLVECDDGLCQVVSVYGIPLVAIKMLERQGVPHYQPSELPEIVRHAIDQSFEKEMRAVAEILDRALTRRANLPSKRIQ